MSGLIYRDIITQIRRSFLGNIIPDILFFFMFLVLLGKYSFSPLTIDPSLSPYADLHHSDHFERGGLQL